MQSVGLATRLEHIHCKTAVVGLSGGLDSSVVTAIAAQRLKERGQRLATYSFEFEGNREFFTPSAFQPGRDQEWALRVSGLLSTDHRTLLCGNQALADSLEEAVLARDLPGMADVDSSLLLFCAAVKRGGTTVCLSGECADELFGGYPWYHREEILFEDTFPWSRSVGLRLGLLTPDALETARNLCASTTATLAIVRQSCRPMTKRPPGCAKCSCSTSTGSWQPCSTARTA